MLYATVKVNKTFFAGTKEAHGEEISSLVWLKNPVQHELTLDLK